MSKKGNIPIKNNAFLIKKRKYTYKTKVSKFWTGNPRSLDFTGFVGVVRIRLIHLMIVFILFYVI